MGVCVGVCDILLQVVTVMVATACIAAHDGGDSVNPAHNTWFLTPTLDCPPQTASWSVQPQSVVCVALIAMPNRHT